MRSPRFGEPARVAFVGQESSDGASALHAPAGGLLPRFFDFRPAAGHDAGDLAAALERWAPHAVVALRPGDLPAGTLAGVGAASLAVGDGPGSGCDRGLSAAGGAWRTAPAPVDDRLFMPVRSAARPPRALFVGESTAHRERFLIGAKHSYDVLHYAHGLHGGELASVLAAVDVGVNVRDELRGGFEHRALVHLAAGHLLISEPLTPAFGLEAGTDFVEVTRPDELMSALYQLERRPDTYDRVRILGRRKAEIHRASRVWPRLVADLLADVAAFGA